MINEKEMIYSIADLVDDKNNMKEIIDGIKTGKYNVIKFENIDDTPTEGDKAVFIIKNNYRDEVITGLNHIKDHIVSIISSNLSSIENNLKN